MNESLTRTNQTDSSLSFVSFVLRLDSSQTHFSLTLGITDNKLPTDTKAVIYNLLDYVGIVKTKADRPVKKLSGGEQQRVAIARALATNVDLIFADEPTGNLDSETESEVITIFKKLAHENDKCVVIVTHANEVASQADVILRIDKGHVTIEKQIENESIENNSTKNI